MATREPGLAFIAFFFMVQLVTYTTGEVKPPWITLLGCFKDAAVTDSRTLSTNSATNCFKECTTSTFVGIQKNTCICRMTFTSITDVQNAELQTYTKCGRGENGFMSVYANVSPIPNTINQDADYGYVYVNISSSSSYEFHASKDSKERHNFICYDNYKQCQFRSGNFDRWESESAWSECNLVSFYDLGSCLKQPSFETGLFWIGMYKNSSAFISISSTLSTRASTSASTSTSTSSLTPQLTIETPTPLTTSTTDKPSSRTLKVETITSTTTSVRTGNITSKGNPNITLTAGAAGSIEKPDTTWTKIGAAFIAISVALVIAIIAVLVAFLRKKKENQISHTDQEKIIRPDSAPTPHINQNSQVRQESASTSSNRRDVQSGRVDEIEQFESDERSENGLSIRTGLHSEINGNHMQSGEHITPFKGEQSHQPLNNENITEEKEDIQRHRHHHHKKDRKHRKHRREQTDANIPSDTAMGKGEEIHRERKKHRKSHHADTELNDVSETALGHSLLENQENDNIKKKKKRKSKKKRKQKHHNTTEESDGINVS